MTASPSAVFAKPTSTKRNGRNRSASLRLLSHDIVLGSQRHGGQIPLEPPQWGERMRKEQPVFELQSSESRLRETPFHLRAADHPCVLIERTRSHGVDRERIERVVLKDEENASLPEYAADLCEEVDMLVVIDVMEDTRSEGHVEAAVVKWQ